MYICTPQKIIMKRTQIYLEEDLLHFLKVESKLQGKRMSSVIREMLMKNFKKKSKSIAFIDNAFGIWGDKKENVEKQIRELRKSSRKNER